MASRLFFWLVVAFFVVQSTWIAVSAAYPQAFDEQFHFGIIQIYSHHWLPFLNSQPPGADPYGAVARDPSFFYHYIMSFPYRLITLFTQNQTAQIIILRFVNIALFAAGLVLFRRVLRRADTPDLATNISTFIVTFIPVAPQLAGQINYDNLLIPLTACACLLTFSVVDRLRRGRIGLCTLAGLLAVCLVSSIVKYEFLPIFLGIVIFLSVFAWKHLRGRWGRTLRQSWKDWRKSSPVKWLAAAAFLAAFALFAQRDIGNMVQYHTVAPDCSRVLNMQQCSAYGVWIHDFTSHQEVINKTVSANPNPVPYVSGWVYWLWYRLFFAINGPDSGFQNYPPLPLPAAAFAGLLILGAVAVIARGRRTFAGRPHLAVLGVITAVYLLTLLGAGYQKYLQTGVLELMNGRYLFPILLPGAAVAATALRAFLKDTSRKLRYAAFAVMLLCFLDGGGALTFIVRSNDSWYWQNTAVQRMNHAAKRVVQPVIADGPTTYDGSKWFFN